MKEVLFLLAFFGLFVPLAGALEILENLPVEDSFYLKTAVFDILVVTVLEVDDEDATNAKPPTGRLRIEAVLRGKLEPREVPFRMDPEIGPDAMVDPQSMDYTLTEQWKARPVKGLPVGETLIVFGAWDNLEKSFTQMGVVFPDRPETRAEILERMGKPEILVAFLAVLLMPFVSIGLIWKGGRSGRRFALWLMPPLSIAVWWLWEMRIPSHAAIRIDLLLILPAIGIVCLLSLLSAFLLSRDGRSRP
jgi:hypothetical protein